MRLGWRARLTIGVGVVAAGGFALLGLRELGGAPRQEAQVPSAAQPTEAAPRALLAATARAIRTGETITADMIRSAPVDPARYPLVAAPVEVIGKVATRDIPAGALIPRDALDQETKLAIRVPLGMRAISIDTSAEIAVAGLLRPGDRVDVQVVYPGADANSGARGQGRSQAQTLLQMVQVLAVGDTVMGTVQANASGAAGQTSSEQQQSAAAAPAVARTVTLALVPEQVSALSLAKSTGALYLSLRNPRDDAQPQVARLASSGPLPVTAAPAAMVPAPVMQQARAAPPPAQRPRTSGHAIDLVVGGNRQVIYSGSSR